MLWNFHNVLEKMYRERERERETETERERVNIDRN